MADNTQTGYIRISDAQTVLGISRPTLQKKLAQLGGVQFYQGVDRREKLISRDVIDRLTRVEPRGEGQARTTA